MGQTESTPPESDSNRPQLYKLIFDQNLDEVHLLIDFISGRSNRSLASLTVPGPQTSSDAMTSREIIQAIANMCFPPKGSDAVNAENAALLLLAKDVLSQLAEPATGLTIAYTAMFVDAEVKTCPNRIWNWTSDLFNSRRAQGRVTRSYLPDQRVDLAARAFPMLQDHAHRFRRWRDGLAWFSVGWLLLTAIAYWDAGLGRAALERLDQNWKVFTEDLKDDPTLVACDLRKDLTDSNVGQDAAHVELACRRFLYQRWKGEAAVKEVQSVFRCDEMSFALSKVVHVWCWKWLLTSYDPTSRHSKDQKSESQLASALSEGATKNRKEPSAEIKENPRHSNDQKDGSQQASALSEGATKNRKEPPQEIRDNATYWQTATSRLSVFTIYVLPMMFALLGTLISSFRALIVKVRDCTLAPRDFVRMLLGVPTGLVAGVAVGLFLSPSSVPVQGSGGVAGQLTLTATGLGFLAGYASQVFFNYLDTIVNTVFPTSVSTTVAAPAAGRATGKPTAGPGPVVAPAKPSGDPGRPSDTAGVVSPATEPRGGEPGAEGGSPRG